MTPCARGFGRVIAWIGGMCAGADDVRSIADGRASPDGEGIGGMLFPVYCGKVLDQFKAAGNEAAAYTQILHLIAFVYLGTFVIHQFLAPRFQQTAVANGGAAG